MTAAIDGSASAHSADTDFTGENVRSKPATAVVCGRDSRATSPASSRASWGSRLNSATKNSRATSVRIRPRSSRGTAAVGDALIEVL